MTVAAAYEGVNELEDVQFCAGEFCLIQFQPYELASAHYNA